MMEVIRLWVVEQNSGSRPAATQVESVHELEAERLLEDVIATQPELLFPGLSIVGRQTPTVTGWLDLLGVDTEGRLVVAELKRGTLARDAVAHVVDYASYLAELDAEELARHIEERSGSSGVEQIDDFEEWYNQTFPGQPHASVLPPRMLLVGLGTDEATERMVRFMAASGVDISMVTFHGFRLNGQVLLARQVRIQAQEEKKLSVSSPSKVAREQNLRGLAEQLEVSERFEDMRRFIKQKFPSAYENIGKTGISFGLLEHAESGNPSYRSYAGIYLVPQQPGRIDIGFYQRTLDLAKDEFEQLRRQFPAAPVKWIDLLFRITPIDQWKPLKDALDPVLTKVYEAWQVRSHDTNASSQV